MNWKNLALLLPLLAAGCGTVHSASQEGLHTITLSYDGIYSEDKLLNEAARLCPGGYEKVTTGHRPAPESQIIWKIRCLERQ